MGDIYALIGPSGAGKTSIVREVLKKSVHARLVESHTTRTARESDLPGEYQYLSTAQFARNVQHERYLWHVMHAGHHYGTPTEAVRTALLRQAQQGIMILVPDVLPRLIHYVERSQSRNEEVGNLFLVYVKPPPPHELKRRLKLRGESDERITRRMHEEYGWGTDLLTLYKDVHVVTNDGKLQDAVEEMLAHMTRS